MYTHFFQLKQAPFSIAPDPHYLYMSERHREALAHLLYGINSGGGFVLLTGEIGAGKTTVCRCFLEQIPENCNIAYIFNPKLTVEELLQSVCDEFGIAVAREEKNAGTIKAYVDALNAHLLSSHAKGQSNVLVIDEAQNLSADVLEQLRLLTNLETNERKLLQIILIGQPELRDMLASPSLQQLAQRVIARYHLGSLSLVETARYILHRLSVAGLAGPSPFRPNSMQLIHQLTQGVPRKINLLCDRAMLGAYAESKRAIDQDIVKKAAAEVFGNAGPRAAGSGLNWRFALPLVAVITGIGAVAWDQSGRDLSWMNSFSSASVPVHETAAQIQRAALTATNTSGADEKEDPAVSALQADLLAFFESDRKQESNLPAELARLWDIRLESGEPCEAALEQGLHCYQGSGGLAELRQLDRPAIIHLKDEHNAPHPAVLLALNKAGAKLYDGKREYTVSLIALGRHLNGGFLTFWRAPKHHRTTLSGGEQGPDVDWLAAQLARLNGAKAEAGQAFDAALIAQLKEFQRAQGLQVDGIAGPKTFMHLNVSAGIAEPRLSETLSLASASQGK
ncbi:MAG: AAA family ATPase [Burkholderiaceae bacterium]